MHTVMADAVVVRQSSLRIQWWLMKEGCNSHHVTNSDGCCSNSAPVVSPHRVLSHAGIVRQSSFRTLWWLKET